MHLYAVDMVHAFHQMSAHAVTTHIQDRIALFIFAMEETLLTLKCAQEREHARMDSVFVPQVLEMIVSIHCALDTTPLIPQFVQGTGLVLLQVIAVATLAMLEMFASIQLVSDSTALILKFAMVMEFVQHLRNARAVQDILELNAKMRFALE